MFIQAPGIVLCEDSYLLDMGIGHVAQGKINPPVAARHRHGTHRTVPGQSAHSVAVAARQNNSNRSHCHSPALINDLPPARKESG